MSRLKCTATQTAHVPLDSSMIENSDPPLLKVNSGSGVAVSATASATASTNKSRKRAGTSFLALLPLRLEKDRRKGDTNEVCAHSLHSKRTGGDTEVQHKKARNDNRRDAQNGRSAAVVQRNQYCFLVSKIMFTVRSRCCADAQLRSDRPSWLQARHNEHCRQGKAKTKHANIPDRRTLHGHHAFLFAEKAQHLTVEVYWLRFASRGLSYRNRSFH